MPVDLEALAAGSQQGLGRAAHEGELIAAETASRRQLAAEAQLHEDEGAREQRRQRAAAQAATQATVKAMTRDFYCKVWLLALRFLGRWSCAAWQWICAADTWTSPLLAHSTVAFPKPIQVSSMRNCHAPAGVRQAVQERGGDG